MHVRDQNWVAVGLDFLIVVVGVFIDILVANWNEEATESSRESGILNDGTLQAGLHVNALGQIVGNSGRLLARLDPGVCR